MNPPARLLALTLPILLPALASCGDGTPAVPDAGGGGDLAVRQDGRADAHRADRGAGKDQKVTPKPDRKVTPPKPDAAGPKPDQKVTPPKTDAAGPKPDQKVTPPKPDAAGPKPDVSSGNPHWKIAATGLPAMVDHTVTLLASGDVLIAGGYENSGTYYKSAWLYQAKSGKLVSAGSMHTARSEHTATLLADGRVLVTGGRDATTYHASCELFDPKKPAAQAWSKGPNLFSSRWSHAAVRLPGGQVMVSGGFGNSDSIDTLALYDPKIGTWTGPAASLSEIRRGHEVLLMKNGKVLIVGGVRGKNWSTYQWSDTLETYDPKTGKITPGTTKMSNRRVGHQLTELLTGEVLITGGFCGSNCSTKQVDDLYDPKTGKITTVAHPGGLPAGHVAALLPGGRVMVVGSNNNGAAQSALAYSPAQKSWSQLPSPYYPRISAEGTGLKDGTVLVVGGVRSTSPYAYNTTIERFYP